MNQPDPIQAQLIAARRSQILDAATKVFAAKGFHGATIRDVAREAGVADGTIYNYFDSKDDLIVGILDRLNETSQRSNDFARATEVNLRDWLRGYIKQRSETLGPQTFPVFQVLLSEILVDKKLRKLYFERTRDPTFELAENFFRQWQAEGLIKQIDSTLATRVIAGTLLGLIVMRLMGDPQLENRWDDLVDVFTEIMMNGLLPGGKDE